MKLLLISDEESSYLWDYYRPGRLDGIDIILSAGDLKPEYLEFLVTMGRAPLLYIHGNHDGIYDEKPPEGCICIDDDVYVYEGIRIAGLGGSMRYNRSKYQYTENEMRELFGVQIEMIGIDYKDHLYRMEEVMPMLPTAGKKLLEEMETEVKSEDTGVEVDGGEQ